jgi:arylsulfatase A-like enzyme
MKRSTLFLFSILSTSIAALAADEPAKRPNVLLIVADDLGYGELSVQGFSDQIPTPNIDSIAKGGVRFTSGYVSGPYCSPTRAALLTGRYQERLGHEFNPGPATTAGEHVGLALTEHTIADRLKPAGYTAAWIGKSHLGYEPEFHPLKRGFDYYYGFLGGAHDYLDSDKGRDPIQRNGVPIPKIDYLTEELGREAAGFIEKNKGQSWFTYLAFNAVHAPLEAPEKYSSRFSQVTDPKRRSFAGMLSALDDAVGVVLAKVRETGQEENTLIFFISDNGGPTPSTTSNNGPLRGYKAQTWEGGVRVPWFVQWKGHIPAGKVDERPVIQLDILPTALAAANVPVSPEWKTEGVNLLPYVTGEKSEPPHEALYWRFGQQIAIRKGDWKLVKGAGEGVAGGAAVGVATTNGAQLFNVTNDIGEKTNLAAQEPAKVKELATAWDEWNKSNIPPKWTPGGGARRANKVAAAAADDDADAASKAANAPAKETPAAAAPTASETPQVANQAFNVSAQIDSATPKGVIIAQGGGGQGYALFVQEGKLALAVREKRKLTVVTATKPLEAGSHQVAAQLAANGQVTLTVDGANVGEGQASILAAQPKEGLTIGGDGKSAVGEYDAPNTFTGTVTGAKVSVLKHE